MILCVSETPTSNFGFFVMENIWPYGELPHEVREGWKMSNHRYYCFFQCHLPAVDENVQFYRFPQQAVREGRRPKHAVRRVKLSCFRPNVYFRLLVLRVPYCLHPISHYCHICLHPKQRGMGASRGSVPKICSLRFAGNQDSDVEIRVKI